MDNSIIYIGNIAYPYILDLQGDMEIAEKFIHSIGITSLAKVTYAATEFDRGSIVGRIDYYWEEKPGVVRNSIFVSLRVWISLLMKG